VRFALEDGPGCATGALAVKNFRREDASNPVNRAVDRPMARVEHNVGLQESEAQKPISKSRRRCWRWWLPSLLLVLAGGMIWLNGPGLRWLGPKVAAHFLAKSGMRADFVLEGSFTGGMAIRDLRLMTDGTLTRLEVDHATPDYRLRELLGGKLRGLRVDGAFLELALDAAKPDGPDVEKAPLDLDLIASELQSVREIIVPFGIEVRGLGVRLTRGEESFLELAPSHLTHQAGADDFQLELGRVTDSSGRIWPEREFLLNWSADSLMLDRLDLLPGMHLHDLAVALTGDAAVSVEAGLRLNEAVFTVTVSPGLQSLGVDLLEGSLDIDWLEKTFSLESPVATTLTSFSLLVDNPLSGLAGLTGSARMLFEETSVDDWEIPELSVDVTLDESRITLAAGGQALGTKFLSHAEMELDRTGSEILPGETSGTFNVADVSVLAAALGGRFEAARVRDSFPHATADGSFRITWAGFMPDQAALDLTLKPADPAEPATLFLTAGWEADDTLSAKLEVEGAMIEARVTEYDIYQGSATFERFRSQRIARWLTPFGIDPGGAHDLTGSWKGGGRIADGIHHGRLEVADYRLLREGLPPVTADGRVDYRWPESFTVEGLHARAAGQSIRAAASLADGWLVLSDLRWSDGELELLRGSAKLPAPADPGLWRETLASDTRPVVAEVTSAVLPLALLMEWLPAAAGLDQVSTGKFDLKLSGTYAKPEVDAAVEVRELRAIDRPDLPPADIDLRLHGSDDRLTLDGTVTTPGYPAAEISASMPFRPAKWAEDPDLMGREPLEARANLPRLELAKFANLVPGITRLGGHAAANIEVAGTITEPSFKGRLDLADVAFAPVHEHIPPLSAGTASVEFTPEQVTLTRLRATVAGGTLSGTGSLTLVDGAPAAYDFRITGDHLPAWRDDSMIVRANASLRLAGDHPRPSVTGDVAVVNSLFFRDIELMPLGMPFTTPSAARLPGIDAPVNPAGGIPEPFRDWPLDLRLTTRNPFLIRGNLASGHLVADIRLRGTLGDPLPNGEIQIHDLKAQLPFSTLTVRRGTLRFTPETGFDPILDIRATADPRPYRVNGFVYGRASDPQLVLTSSPPLPENEIMTLLATGTTTSGLEDPQMASSRALQLLLEETRRGRNIVGRQLRPLLGLLDRVDFTLAEADPYSSDAYSTATLSLTDRWLLSAGMSDDGDTRILAIWRLVFR